MGDIHASKGGQKRSPPSLKCGSAFACAILVTKEASESSKFIIAPESLGEPSSESWVSPPSSDEVTHGTPMKCMFNYLDEVLTHSTIFVKSFTFSPQELSGGDPKESPSLALVVGGRRVPPLTFHLCKLICLPHIMI